MNLQIISIALSFALISSAATEHVPGIVIDHQRPVTQQYIGSPSIVIAPNGNYVASHDLFGPGSTSTKSAETKIFISQDRGKVWKLVADVYDQFWSNLFGLKNRLYLMGTTAEYGHIVIRTSDDNGLTWSGPHLLTSGTGYHTAPVPVVVHDGRLYRAFEYHPPGPWGSFEAFVMWAPVSSDLTKAESWSFSNRLSFPVGEQGNAWLEGNVVINPEGSVVDILRVNNLQHIAILKFEGSNLRFDRFADFPGGATKFTVRFDPPSRLYWTLCNPALSGDTQTVSSPGSVRNTLALMSSPDLTHWTPRAIVLHNPDSLFHAFQYVDWQFDGSDIIAVSRTAFDDEDGTAHSFHDANYFTFHRISSFRKLGVVNLAGSPFPAAEVVPASAMEKWTGTTANDAGRSDLGVFSQRIGEYSNHTTTLTTRVRTGDAEQHRDWYDIFVVVSGEASLVSGGQLKDVREIAPGELRGSGVTGGVIQSLTPGTVVHIDPQTPHQLIIAPSHSLTYFVVKLKK
jgi:mannose-6-phosphate isomerase-like protein (cupin superfamily)